MSSDDAGYTYTPPTRAELARLLGINPGPKPARRPRRRTAKTRATAPVTLTLADRWPGRDTVTVNELAAQTGLRPRAIRRALQKRPEAIVRFNRRILVRLDRLDTIFEETA
ncbi:MAG: hypothetical protein Q4B10_03295 [Actinomycetaceae bacterium]|nr:hypothetical protein [Actinomycetaceae bacterium]